MSKRHYRELKNRMPRVELPDVLIIEEAQDAIEYAQAVRKLHARRSPPGSRQREVDIHVALTRLGAAMFPIRRKAAMWVYHNSLLNEEIRGVSKAMQRERRKLWKMQRNRGRKRRN